MVLGGAGFGDEGFGLGKGFGVDLCVGEAFGVRAGAEGEKLEDGNPVDGKEMFGEVLSPEWLAHPPSKSSRTMRAPCRILPPFGRRIRLRSRCLLRLVQVLTLFAPRPVPLASNTVLRFDVAAVLAVVVIVVDVPVGRRILQ